MKVRTKSRTKIVKTTVTTTIRAPVEAVFTGITGADRLPGWQPRATRARYTPDEPPHTGSVLHVATALRGTRREFEWRFRVTTFEPGSAVAWHGARGPFTFDYSFTVRPVDSGTRLRCVLQVGAREWAARLLVRPVARVFGRRLTRWVQEIRGRLEYPAH